MNESLIKNLKQFCSIHFEWITFLVGLLAVGLMDPYTNNGPSFCLFEFVNVPFCPGEGLGHSIAFLFRGDLGSALEANMLGPVTLIILSSRIAYLFTKRVIKTNINSG